MGVRLGKHHGFKIARVIVVATVLAQVSQPMDLATLLSRVDSRLYATPPQFMADVALIPQASFE